MIGGSLFRLFAHPGDCPDRIETTDRFLKACEGQILLQF